MSENEHTICHALETWGPTLRLCLINLAMNTPGTAVLSVIALGARH